MVVRECLQAIQSEWMKAILLNSSPEGLSKKDLSGQISAFYQQLIQAASENKPEHLDPELVSIVSSLTYNDYEGKYNQVSQTLKIYFDNLVNIAASNLYPTQFADLIQTIVPIFSHAFEYAAEMETKTVSEQAKKEIESIKQQMEKLDRSKSDFIAIAAHELKTPLTLIEGYSLMLAETENPSNSEYTDHLIDGIRNGAKRLKMIIDDMVDVSLIDNNLLELNFQPVWLNQIFSQLDAELKPALKQRNINLHIDPFPGFNEMTFGTPDRLLQVFRNLLVNAIKFTPDHGDIFIEGRKLPGFIEVVIRDTGIGINPEDQSLIFNKFSRVGNVALHSTGKTKFKGGGPGLGLHIAKGIIESHGGAIWVESEGCNEKTLPGSAFHVIIPMKSIPPDDKMGQIFSSYPNFKKSGTTQ